jgi:hypothetical protein
MGQELRLGYQRRDPRRYREEAARIRQKADETSDPVLRDSYLELAEAYASLADTLDLTRSR